MKNQVDFGLTRDQTFVDAVLTGDASRVRSSYKSVAFALACNRSMESGQPVKVVY